MANPLFGIFNARNGQTNNFMQLIAAMRNGTNPIAALNVIAPQMAQQLAGKSPQEIENLVRNECMRQGINPDQMVNTIMQMVNSTTQHN